MEDIGTAKTTTGGYILLLAFAGGMLALAASLFAFSTVLIKALAAVPGLIGTAVLFALWQNQRFG